SFSRGPGFPSSAREPGLDPLGSSRSERKKRLGKIGEELTRVSLSARSARPRYHLSKKGGKDENAGVLRNPLFRCVLDSGGGDSGHGPIHGDSETRSRRPTRSARPDEQPERLRCGGRHGVDVHSSGFLSRRLVFHLQLLSRCPWAPQPPAGPA